MRLCHWLGRARPGGQGGRCAALRRARSSGSSSRSSNGSDGRRSCLKALRVDSQQFLSWNKQPRGVP